MDMRAAFERLVWGVTGCMAALQAEHFLQLHGSSFPSENGNAVADTAKAPAANVATANALTSNGGLTEQESAHAAVREPVAVL